MKQTIILMLLLVTPTLALSCVQYSKIRNIPDTCGPNEYMYGWDKDQFYCASLTTANVTMNCTACDTHFVNQWETWNSNLIVNGNATAGYFIGDGSQLTGINPTTNCTECDKRFVNVDGDTMTGNLTLTNLTADYVFGDGSYLTNIDENRFIVPAENITSGVFGANQGYGTFVFEDGLNVSSTFVSDDIAELADAFIGSIVLYNSIYHNTTGIEQSVIEVVNPNTGEFSFQLNNKGDMQFNNPDGTGIFTLGQDIGGMFIGNGAGDSVDVGEKSFRVVSDNNDEITPVTMGTNPNPLGDGTPGTFAWFNTPQEDGFLLFSLANATGFGSNTEPYMTFYDPISGAYGLFEDYGLTLGGTPNNIVMNGMYGGSVTIYGDRLGNKTFLINSADNYDVTIGNDNIGYDTNLDVKGNVTADYFIGNMVSNTVNGNLKVTGNVNATNITIGDPWTFRTYDTNLLLAEEGEDTLLEFDETGMSLYSGTTEKSINIIGEGNSGGNFTLYEQGGKSAGFNIHYDASGTNNLEIQSKQSLTPWRTLMRISRDDYEISVLGNLTSEGYQSSDGSQGITETLIMSATCNVTVKDGLITGYEGCT